jgi:hypothetical protein
MPVIDGQAVSAAVTNPAFLDAQIDDIALGKIGLHNSDLANSGPFIDNTQRCINRLFTAAGVNETTSDGTTYNATSGTIINGDPYELAFRELANKFDSITGHTHNTSLPGDGAQITIPLATSGSQGSVFLSSTTPLDVTGSDIIGTYNNQVALADHAHKGVRSVAASGGSQLFNDIVLTPSGAVTMTTSGQQIIFNVPTQSTGVTSIAASGNTAITGAVILAPSGEISLSQTGQTIFISAPAAAGSGVSSLSVSGSIHITGDVTLSPSGEITLTQSGQNISIFAPTASTSALQTVHIRDEKAENTDGGTFTSGAYRTRDLNTLVNPGGYSWVSLSSNQITLASGTYLIAAQAPCTGVDRNQAKLRNTSDSTNTVIGTSCVASAADGDNAIFSFIVGQFTIASSKTFEIQHQCQTTRSTNGFGNHCGMGNNEVYTIVQLQKIA